MSRFLTREALVLGALAAVGACGGPQRAVREDNLRLSENVSVLKAQARRDRRTIQDLENRIFVLEDQLETAKVSRDRAPGRTATLPVVVRRPAAEPTVSAPEPAPGELTGGEDEGVEIVYEGEAAREDSVRPRISLYEDARPAEPTRVTPPAADPPAPLPPLPATAAADRLPTTSGPVPPLSAAYRRAHAAPPPERAKEVPKRAESPPLPADPEAQYRQFYAALRARNHGYAIAGFRGFLKRFPDHDYADNAQYWLGEAYYDQQDYRGALVEFRAVVEHHADGNKVPDALLKIGYCYLALGEPGPARAVLGQLIEIHPKSNAAALAARRLEELAGK